jgi:hypothetical protein
MYVYSSYLEDNSWLQFLSLTIKLWIRMLYKRKDQTQPKLRLKRLLCLYLCMWEYDNDLLLFNNKSNKKIKLLINKNNGNMCWKNDLISN